MIFWLGSLVGVSGFDPLSMSVSIFSWNVRGLGNKEKKAAMKDLSTRCKAKVIMIQETKASSMGRAGMREICSFQCLDGLCLPSIKALGGIWVLSDAGEVIVDDFVGSFSVSVKGTMLGNGTSWVLVCTG